MCFMKNNEGNTRTIALKWRERLQILLDAAQGDKVQLNKGLVNECMGTFMVFETFQKSNLMLKGFGCRSCLSTHWMQLFDHPQGCEEQ